MSLYQGPSVVTTPGRMCQAIYPLDIYQTAEAGCKYSVNSPSGNEQETSRLITNLVIEALTKELLEPLAQIPELTAKVSKGALDQETFQKVNNVFARFPFFAQSLAEGKLGQPLQGDRKDVAQRVTNLLLANKGALIKCEGTPLIGLLGACMLRTKKISKGDVIPFLSPNREGSLADAIGLKACAMMDEALRMAEERRLAADERLRVSQVRLEKAQRRNEALDIIVQKLVELKII